MKKSFYFQVWYCKKKIIVLIIESVITINCINSLCYHSLILVWWLIQEFYIQKNSFKYNQTLHAATFMKRSHFSCPVMENFIWIEPLLRGGHLTYKITFSLSQWWPLNSSLTSLKGKRNRLETSKINYSANVFEKLTSLCYWFGHFFGKLYACFVWLQNVNWKNEGNLFTDGFLDLKKIFLLSIS